MTKQYISRNGQIEYEIDEAGEILTYGRDALGNVVAGYDKNTNAVFTIDYKPFGEFAATTGTITGRRFLWVGTWGYRFTPGVPVSHYIRARHLMMRMGMWTTVDPLWPGELAYGYVKGEVVTRLDPNGLTSSGWRAWSRVLPWPLMDPIYLVPPNLRFKCRDNTNYWKSQCSESGNKFECCASKVSEFICASVFLFAAQGQFILSIAFDCQNTCMKNGHERGVEPGWADASKVCCEFGERSRECCEASFMVEQKEYERCAKECFRPLLQLPYHLRIEFGLKGLKCCD